MAPSGSNTLEVENPATLEQCAIITIGIGRCGHSGSGAKAAFEIFSQTSVEERVALLDKIAEIYKSRIGEIAEEIWKRWVRQSLASTSQAYAGLAQLRRRQRFRTSPSRRILARTEWLKNPSESVV